MERKQLLFTPQWKGPCEGYAVNYMNKNVWRVQPEHDVEDLMQDAYMYFLVCRDNYPLVTEPSHFMALFRTCLFNHVCYLASLRSKRRQFLADDITENGLDEFAFKGDEFSDVEMKMLLEDAPEVVLKLLHNLDQAERPFKMKKRRNSVRESTNTFLCRILGTDPTKTDVRTVFENWIKGEQSCSLSVNRST